MSQVVDHAVLRGAAVAASPVLGVPAGSISSKCASSLAPSEIVADEFLPDRAGNPAPPIARSGPLLAIVMAPLQISHI